MESNNPYAPPLTPVGESSDRDLPPLEVRGSYLLVQQDTTLPMRCVKTNEDVGSDQLIQATYGWAPPFRLVVSLLKLRVNYFVGQAKQRELGRRRFAGAMLLLSGIVIELFRALYRWPTGSSGLLLAVLGLVVMRMATRYSYLRVVRFRDNRFWLTGFGKEFLASIDRAEA